MKHQPLLKNLTDETPLITISPPPSLHIILGIFNHIWRSMENISEEIKNLLHKYAVENNCIKESYWGCTFEGNECCKLLSRINPSVPPFLNILEIKKHANALEKFNKLRIEIFGMNINDNWQEALMNFKYAYNEIPNITKPLKLHILFNHVEEFILKYGSGKGLGFYSEQTGESIHQKFAQLFNKYKMKNIESEQYGPRLKKAVVEFSSTRI